MIYSRFKRILAWLLATGICLALTPAVFSYADAQRGYDATGGEIFFPLLPLFAWAIHRTIADAIKEFKTDESEENEDD
jgi:hypothetical protein